MTLEKLDNRAALIVIDLQAGTLGNPTVHPAEQIVENSASLAEAFRHRGLPVVVATVVGSPAGRTGYGGGQRSYPSEFAVVAPELRVQPTDILVTRATWSAFAGTDLSLTLRQLGVSQVVLVGIATSFGVESTARAAYDLGYDVVVVTDAVTDLRVESHENSVARVFPALSQAATTGELLQLLA